MCLQCLPLRSFCYDNSSFPVLLLLFAFSLFSILPRRDSNYHPRPQIISQSAIVDSSSGVPSTKSFCVREREGFRFRDEERNGCALWWGRIRILQRSFSSKAQKIFRIAKLFVVFEKGIVGAGSCFGEEKCDVLAMMAAAKNRETHSLVTALRAHGVVRRFRRRR